MDADGSEVATGPSRSEELRMREEPSAEGSRCFCELAADPARLETLYDALRDFCHTFRNRLNLIQLSLFLARKSETVCPARWDELDAQYRAVERLMDQFQTLCRPLQLQTVRMDLRHLLDDRFPVWSAWLGSRGIGLEIEPPAAPLVVDFDPSRLGLGLDALARWRAEEAPGGSLVRLNWSGLNGQIKLNWDEIAPPDSSPDSKSVIPLALLTRMISAHSGRIALGEPPGLRIEMAWPVTLVPEPTRPANAPGPSRGVGRKPSIAPLATSLAGC
jgi:hypothetical protein